MLGYVLPLPGELKVKEFQRFQSVYCGLCHAMGKQCGWHTRFLLSYDFTFLAMLLDETAQPPEDRFCRCMASPFRKRRVCGATAGLERAADAGVILAFWKLRDTIEDEGFFKRVGARLLSLFFRPAYRRAARRRAALDESVRRCLTELRQMEAEGCKSLDRAADAFARLMQAVGAEAPEAEKRPVEQVLYHVGRWVYLADAYDDLAEDLKRKRYNPLAARLELSAPTLTDQDRAFLETTMRHSLNLAAAAYALLPEGRWSPILDNILHLGLPAAGARVLTGQPIRGKPPKRMPGSGRNGLETNRRIGI